MTGSLHWFHPRTEGRRGRELREQSCLLLVAASGVERKEMLTLSMSNCSPCFRKSEEQDFFVKVLHKPSHSSNLLCIYYLNYFFRVSFLDPDIFGCVFLKILNRYMCPDSAFSCQLFLPHSEESPLKVLSNLKPILSSLPLDPGS